MASGGSRRRWVASWRGAGARLPPRCVLGRCSRISWRPQSSGAGAGHWSCPGDTHLSARSPSRRELTGEVWLGWTQKSLGTKPKAKGHNTSQVRNPAGSSPQVTYLSVPRYSGVLLLGESVAFPLAAGSSVGDEPLLPRGPGLRTGGLRSGQSSSSCFLSQVYISPSVKWGYALSAS